MGKADGLAVLLGDTSTITPCQETCYILMVFELRFAAYGVKPSNVVARETGFSGRDMDALPTSIYQGPEPLIPTQKNASRHVP